MTAAEPVPPPDTLGVHGATLWTSTVSVYELSSHELELLGQACATLDMVALLEERVATDGTIVEGSAGQPVLHPAVGEARQQRLGFARLLAQLALPDADGETLRTPEQVRAAAGGRGKARRARRLGVV